MEGRRQLATGTYSIPRGADKLNGFGSGTGGEGEEGEEGEKAEAGGRAAVRGLLGEDRWSGMCVKVACDHLGLGVKTGMPYVWRNDRGDAIASLRKEWEGVKLMEEVVPFFQSVRLPREATTTEDCVAEVANVVKEQLGSKDPIFARAAKAMVDWVMLWKSVGSSTSSPGA